MNPLAIMAPFIGAFAGMAIASALQRDLIGTILCCLMLLAQTPIYQSAKNYK